MTSTTRLARAARQLGSPLPADYAQFLWGHRQSRRGPDRVVSSNPGRWRVSIIFELADGPAVFQADAVFRQLSDVLPPRTWPIAQDGADNLFLLDCGQGPGRGQVLWWEHERASGDRRTERVAGSLSDFLRLLIRRPGEPGSIPGVTRTP
jgi:hypothetical protein